MLGTTWARQSLCSTSSLATSSRVRLTQTNNVNSWMHWHRARMSSSSGASVKDPTPARDAKKSSKSSASEKKVNANENRSKKPRRYHRAGAKSTLPRPFLPIPDEAANLTVFLRQRNSAGAEPFRKIRSTVMGADNRELEPPIPLIRVPKPVSLGNFGSSITSPEPPGDVRTLDIEEEVPEGKEGENVQEGEGEQEGEKRRESVRENRTRPPLRVIFKNITNPLSLRGEFIETVREYLGSLYTKGHLTSPEFAPSNLIKTRKIAKDDLLRAAYHELVNKHRYEQESDFWARFTALRDTEKKRRRRGSRGRGRKERKDTPHTTVEMPSRGTPTSPPSSAGNGEGSSTT